MSRTYYVIELTARWLTVLVVGLAVLLVAAFVLGYGAAWSVLGVRHPAPVGPAGPSPTPTVTEVFIQATPTPAVRATALATATPTETPVAAMPTATQAPPTATPTATPADERLWVQVLASSRRDTVEEARTQLEELGFPRDHHDVVEAPVAGGNVLFKVRVGPFPDRESADRVVVRMQAAGFPDAWVVTP